MADAMQGIMALPGAPGNMDQGPMAPPPGQGPGGIDPGLINPQVSQYARSNPEEFSQGLVDSLDQADPALVYELRSALAGMDLPAEVVDALLTMVDLLMQDPANYAQNRQMFIDEGVPQEILPPNFDPIFLTGLQMALSETRRGAGVPKFARGGIVELKPIAKAMAQMGRNGDTMLAHITPGEARMLRVMGGSGTINPITGLPEFFVKKFVKAVTGTVKNVAKAVGSVVKSTVNVVKEVVKPVANAVKKIAQNPIGKIALTVAAVYFMGPGALTTAGVAGSMGLTGATALGVNTALASTAVNLASGQSLKESLKGGAISGLTAGTISHFFPSTLPAAYKAGPGPLAAPVSAADYGMSVDSIDRSFGEAAREAGLVPPAEVITNVPASISADGAAVNLSSFGASPGTGEVIYYPLNRVAETPVPRAQPIQVASAPVASSTATDVTSGIRGNAPVEITGTPPPPNLPFPTSDLSNLPLPPAGYGPGVGGPPPAPSLLDRGIGAVRTAYDTVAQPVKNFYEEYLSPSRGAPTREAIQAKIKDLNQMGVTGIDAYREAVKQLTPGMISQYGPLALAGGATLAATGAFTPKQPPPPGIVDSDYMRRGSAPGEDIGIGGVNTVFAPGQSMGYGSTSFYELPTGYSPATNMFAAPQFRVRRPEEYLNLGFLNQRYAKGGIASLNNPRTYPRKTGAINGPGTETSDSIPALLSDGEFVLTARAVRGAGGGSRRIGAKRMYAMMKALEKKANG